jgi:GDP-4-dehydro-6-deoxy-D-mannose reductase
MKKILITGFSGFVSKFFINYLENNHIHTEILGIDVSDNEIYNKDYKFIKISFVKVNLFEADGIEKLIFEFQPDYLLHLASYSSVSFSWQNPVLSFQNNTNIFLNIIEAIRHQNLKTRILSIGSSEEYGNVSLEQIPLKEEYPVNPVNPYAVARVSQELISKVYASGYNMNIIMTRSFNHIGPEQSQIFVVSSFAKQLCQIKLNGGKGTIDTGDVTIIRDFLDVRDVVDAYYKLLIKGKVGEIYNVCGGKGISLKEIIDMMTDILQIDVKININKNLIRPVDNRIIIGSNAKINSVIDWNQNHSIYSSLKDMIDYWMVKLNDNL